MIESPLPVRIFSELAHCEATPTATATLKQQADDFQVDEVLGFEFDGKPGHVCLLLEKTGITTTAVAELLARRYGVSARDVGYAGMKDKRGVCTQWFSVPQSVGAEPDPAALEDGALQVRDMQRNSRKIHIGSHRGNQFRIRLRSVQGDSGDLIARLERVARSGVPNYFGPQRFGHGGANVAEAWRFLAAATGGREPRQRRSLLISAARSFLFNQILSRRVLEQSWERALEGEVLNLDGTARFFALPEGGAGDPEILRRLGELDIHPTGLLAGKENPKDRYRPGATLGELEKQVLSPWREAVDGLAERGVMAGRRALRLAVRDLHYRWTQPDQLELEFALTAGGYATTVLRELVMTSGPDDFESRIPEPDTH